MLNKRTRWDPVSQEQPPADRDRLEIIRFLYDAAKSWPSGYWRQRGMLNFASNRLDESDRAHTRRPEVRASSACRSSG